VRGEENVVNGFRRTTAVLAACLVVLVATGTPAVAAPATTDEVYAALGVDKVAADYVVMVDVSGSMREDGRYDQVKRSLLAFFAALAPDDRVALVTFADKARVVRASAPAGRSPDALIAKLPKTADGDHTDLGAAIEQSLAVLRRDGAPPTATVVLLTDGLHDPAANSAYPFTQGYAWNQLRAAAKGLRKTSLNAYAIPLAGSTGAGLLGKVYPGAKVLDPTSIDRLGTQLEQPKAAARAAKARAVLGADATRGVRVQWPAEAGRLGAGRTELRVRLHSTAAHVPLVVGNLAVRSTDPALRATVQGGPVSLAPGGTAEVRVTVDWDAGPRQAAPLHTETGRGTLTLTGAAGSPWHPVLTEVLGLKPAPAWTGGETPAVLSAQRGSWPYWLAGALLVLAVLVLLGLLGKRRLHPMLSGTLSMRTANGDERKVALGGRAMVLNAGTAGLPGYGEVRATRASVGAAETALTITYSRDGSPAGRETSTCRPGEQVTVSGTQFAWLTGVPAQRGGAPTRSRSLRGST